MDLKMYIVQGSNGGRNASFSFILKVGGNSKRKRAIRYVVTINPRVASWITLKSSARNENRVGAGSEALRDVG